MSGLHSYRDEVTVDFDEAVQDGLFGIFGPTGSGKSTLLDAMTLALYGRVDRLAGNEVTPMVNVDADELVVTYTFQLGDTTYQAHRRLVRSGDAAQQRDAELRNLTGDRTLASQAREVTRAVEQLLGMDFDQFTRAVFLPQGKFARFLEDTPTQRLELLEEIFGLDRYGERLRKRARERRDDLQRRHDRLQGTLEELDEVSKEEIQALEDKLETADEKVQNLSAREQELDQEVQQARTLETLLDKLDEAREELFDLEEKREEVEDVRERLERAEQATKPHRTLVDLREARERLEEQTERIEALREQAEDQDQALAKAKRTQDERLQEIEERARDLEDARARLETLQTEAPRLDELREDRRRARGRLDELEDEHVEQPPEYLGDAELDELQERLGEGQRLQDRIQRLEADREQALERRGQARFELDQLDHDLEELEERIEELEEQSRQATERLEEARLADRAWALAHELEPGEPCPVCGSPEHPDPAGEAKTPLDDLQAEADRLEGELAQARQRRERLTERATNLVEQANKARQEAAQIEQRLEQARDERDEIRESLPEALEGRSFGEARDQVRAWQRGVQAKQARSVLDDLKDRLRSARERFEGVREVLEVEYEEPTEAAIRAARQRLQETRQALDDEEHELQEEVEAAREARDEVKEKLSELEGAREQLASQVEELSERLESQLGQTPFASEGDIVEAHEPPEVRSELRSTIEDFEDRYERAKSEVERLSEEIEDVPLEPEQASEVVEEHERVEEELGEARQARGKVQERLENARNRLERKRELTDDLGELEEDLTRAQRLTRLLGGRRFVEFLARDRFDTVLLQASRRLAQVSGGQYHLEGSPTEIRVVDQMAGGEIRDLRTLSGGETFMVSLSLALALSDAIQHERGGGYPPIEFFFLDEGFGSLDQDTLDTVMRMLHELVDQDVYVGLITHVEEAQRYVPRQVQVKPATEEHGSRVEVLT